MRVLNKVLAVLSLEQGFQSGCQGLRKEGAGIVQPLQTLQGAGEEARFTRQRHQMKISSWSENLPANRHRIFVQMKARSLAQFHDGIHSGILREMCTRE